MQGLHEENWEDVLEDPEELIGGQRGTQNTGGPRAAGSRPHPVHTVSATLASLEVSQQKEGTRGGRAETVVKTGACAPQRDRG